MGIELKRCPICNGNLAEGRCGRCGFKVRTRLNTWARLFVASSYRVEAPPGVVVTLRGNVYFAVPTYRGRPARFKTLRKALATYRAVRGLGEYTCLEARGQPCPDKLRHLTPGYVPYTVRAGLRGRTYNAPGGVFIVVTQRKVRACMGRAGIRKLFHLLSGLLDNCS